MKENEETRLARFRKQCDENASVSAGMVSLSGGVSLSVVTFTPRKAISDLPVLFVPGLASVVETFTGVIRALAGKFIVHYLETREKRSSQVPGGASFSVSDLAADIASAAEKLELEDRNYILISYSLSATLSIEMFSTGLKLRPALMVLVQPLAEFRIPRFGIPAARYLYPFYPVIKPLLKLYFKRSLIDTGKDKEMYNISVRSLDSVHPAKMAKTLPGMSGYRVADSAAKVDVPVVVIGTSADTFHSHDDAAVIGSMIKGAVYMDLVTNTISHSGKVCDIVLSFLEKR